MSPEEDAVPDDDAIAPEHVAVAAVLRHALHEVARATPTDALVVGTHAVATRRRGGWPRALAAAAVVLVVGLAVLLVAGRPADHGVERAGDGGGAGADHPAAGLAGPVDDPDLDTGWYVPGAGWTIAAVRIEYLDVGEEGACPCLTWAAARPGDDGPVLELAETGIPDAADGAPPDLPSTAVDVGGRAGRRAELTGGTETVWVETGGRRILVASRDVPDRVVGDVVAAWADAVDAGRPVDPAALPLPAGYAGTPVRVKEGVYEHVVSVTAERTGTGERAEYRLVPAGTLRPLLTIATTIAAADDGVLAFVTGSSLGAEGLIVGAFGGSVDLTAGVDRSGGAPSDLDRGDVEALVASLREVDARTWRAALPDGAVDDAVRTAPTLFAPPLTG